MSTSVASVVSHFPDAENGFTTTLASTISSGAATVPLNSVAGYTNGMPAVFVVDPSDATKKQTFTGIIDTAGVQVTSVVWTAGTNQSHSGGATVVDYATATHMAMVTKGILVHSDQDGTLKAGSVDNAAVLASDVVTTAKILDANVTTAKILDGNVTNAKLATTTNQPGGAWESWTPTWANFTIGNGTNDCKYKKVGNTIEFRIVTTLGSTSSMGTSPTFTLPVTSITSPHTFLPIAWGNFYDASAATYKDPGIAIWTNTTTATVRRYDGNNDGNTVSSTTPFTWTTSDAMLFQGTYEAA